MVDVETKLSGLLDVGLKVASATADWNAVVGGDFWAGGWGNNGSTRGSKFGVAPTLTGVNTNAP